MTDDYVDMTDENGHQFTLTGRYRMACWRIDELTSQLSASESSRFAAENLAAEMAGLVREAEQEAERLTALVQEAMELLHHTEKLGERISEEEWSRRYFALLARTAPKE